MLSYGHFQESKLTVQLGLQPGEVLYVLKHSTKGPNFLPKDNPIFWLEKAKLKVYNKLVAIL